MRREKEVKGEGKVRQVLIVESPYGVEYYDYRWRLEHHDAHKEKTKGHRHNMAVRYMIKQFLCDLDAKWRELEGLEVSQRWHEAKGGHVHRAVA